MQNVQTKTAKEDSRYPTSCKLLLKLCKGSPSQSYFSALN